MLKNGVPLNLLKSMNELEKFLAEVAALVDAPKEIVKEYRVFYDDKGEIVGQSMVEPHLDGTYIVVTEEEYNNIHRYAKVKDSELKIKVFSPGYKRQLLQGETGFTVVKNHAGILLEQDETYDDTEQYGYRDY